MIIPHRIPWVVAILLSSACGTGPAPPRHEEGTLPGDGREQGFLAVVSDPASSHSSLVDALSALDTVTEGLDLEFWERIASDERFSGSHRRLCLYELFRRHVARGIRFGRLAALPSAPKWFNEVSLENQDMMSRIPLSRSREGRSTFRLTLAFTHAEDFEVYLSFSKLLTARQIAHLASGTAVDDSLEIVEAGTDGGRWGKAWPSTKE